jgi:GNAT superfamily N-acetyltransferase
MDFERCRFTDADINAYAALFAACFPGASKLGNRDYLRWLYSQNPLGHAIGFNAVADGRVAAHYICTRALVRFGGEPVPALLSLNTATHPDFQGRGLFTRLAELTYAAGAAEGAAFVYGVANANSTPGFVRKLGFDLVESLESRIGMGSLGRFDWERVDACARFRQAWTPDYLAWRAGNPAGPVRLRRAGGRVVADAASGRPGVRAWAEIRVDGEVPSTPAPRVLAPRVWLGLMPADCGRFGLYARLPARLRPSPLNLIFRPLAGGGRLSAGETAFSFLDFDAF